MIQQYRKPRDAKSAAALSPVALSHERISEIFLAACRAAPAERAAVLEGLCHGHPQLKSEVESLLRYHDEPAALLDGSAISAAEGAELLATLSRHGPAAPMPEQIGRYRILDQLGEGGMGVVYLAQQDRPRRLVALKVIRPAFAMPDLLRRFEFEQEILARLQHPGIAQIYEAGVDGDGRPFFAMEYINGRPLADFARECKLTISQKLRLLAQACDAVQHAHQRGVIHRDLKPANILVVDHESRARGAESERRKDALERPASTT